MSRHTTEAGIQTSGKILDFRLHGNDKIETQRSGEIESVYKVRTCHPRACLPAGRLDPGIQNLLRRLDSRLRISGMTNRKREFIHRH